MLNTLVKLTDLHAHYGLSHVLHGVNLEIKRGETVGLMGRNGMGKTTLIKCLLGLVSISSGEIQFREQNTKTLPTHTLARGGIAYVPEGRGIFKNLSRCPHASPGHWWMGRWVCGVYGVALCRKRTIEELLN